MKVCFSSAQTFFVSDSANMNIFSRSTPKDPLTILLEDIQKVADKPNQHWRARIIPNIIKLFHDYPLDLKAGVIQQKLISECGWINGAFSSKANEQTLYRLSDTIKTVLRVFYSCGDTLCVCVCVCDSHVCFQNDIYKASSGFLALQASSFSVSIDTPALAISDLPEFLLSGEFTSVCLSLCNHHPTPKTKAEKPFVWSRKDLTYSLVRFFTSSL